MSGAIITFADRLVLRSELAELSQLTAWTQDFARRTKLSSDTLFALQLCIEEAVANIIMHGGAPADRQESRSKWSWPTAASWW